MNPQSTTREDAERAKAVNTVAPRNPLDLYARVLVERGTGLRPGQDLYIRGRRSQRDFALRLGEAAYSLGAGRVRYHLVDPLETAQLIRRAQPAQIEIHHLDNQDWYGKALAARTAVVLLHETEAPTNGPRLAGSRYQTFTRGAREANRQFLRLALERWLCPCVLAPVPTPSWARRIFPQLPQDQAFSRLLELILRFTNAEESPEAKARAGQSEGLRTMRRRLLSSLGIRELSIRGPGSDLRLRLSPAACWLDGRQETLWGQPFYFNLPCEEIFTTPDCRETQGILEASRPLILGDGERVKNLVLEFRRGRVVAFEASEGKEALARFFDLEPGAGFLGEIALVGEDSPLARSGLSFGHPVYDENSAAHVALGHGLASCLKEGASLPEARLEALGCNRSSLHADVLFGCKEVSIDATQSRQGKIALLRNGAWTERFRM